MAEKHKDLEGIYTETHWPLFEKKLKVFRPVFRSLKPLSYRRNSVGIEFPQIYIATFRS